MVGKVLLLSFVLYSSYLLLFTTPHWIFLDYFNLIIHEAGHTLFSPFGKFIEIFGGSFLQIFIPFLICFYFILHDDFFSAYFSLFWVGNNFINVSVYVADAQAQQLPLIADDLIHDWNWLLTETNTLTHTSLIANMLFAIGAILLIIGNIGMMGMIAKYIFYSPRFPSQSYRR